MLQIMDEQVFGDVGETRGITDLWNTLTESEKRLCIRYPFDALKVNTARKIATEQTERKFGYSGLGDRSDAFRHGIWNAEMSILIGSEKAELLLLHMKIKMFLEMNPMAFLKQLIKKWIYIIMKWGDI